MIISDEIHSFCRPTAMSVEEWKRVAAREAKCLRLCFHLHTYYVQFQIIGILKVYSRVTFPSFINFSNGFKESLAKFLKIHRFYKKKMEMFSSKEFGINLTQCEQVKLNTFEAAVSLHRRE